MYPHSAHDSDSLSSAGPSPTDPTFGSIDDTYYSQEQIRPHAPHPHCPNALSCLQDTNDRPHHTLAIIVRCAILGSPKKRLTSREIYTAMERKYPYFKTAPPVWKVIFISNGFRDRILMCPPPAICQTSSLIASNIRASTAPSEQPWVRLILDGEP